MNTKSKNTSKDVKKSQSSVSLVSNKHDTLNSDVSKSNINVLKAKIVNAVNVGSNLVCVSCGKDVFMISHDKCVARYALSLNSRVIQIILWIVDSWCSKHMTGNLNLLRYFIEKFIGTVRFGNDNFAAITGYGDYVQGNLMICHVYYVEVLRHNIFLVGQFCDGDLEVAFCSNNSYVRNLKGEDLLTSSRDYNLYTISISEMAASSRVCLMSKATSTKSWLWHHRLSHLNFVSSSEEPIVNEPSTLVLDNHSDEPIQEDVVELDGNAFINAFGFPAFEEADSSLNYQDPSNMHEFYQKHHSIDT
ncbi:retrovirus-related pol polyprotein from transposon TNT 1-94 [Tanacetum coccineum]